MYSQAESIIGYNEFKCQKGTAEVMDSNFFAEDKLERLQVLNEQLGLNSNVKQNKFFQIILSANLEDNINNDNFTKIANDYMEQMGYKDCPFLMYRHHDTAHSHIHIVGCTIDHNGKKVKEAENIIDPITKKERLMGNYEKSNKICKSLEKKYDLVISTSHDRKNIGLKEINYDKYRYQRAILKVIDSSLKLELSKIPGISKITDVIKNKPLTNYQIKQEIGGESFKLLFKFLEETENLEKSKKEVLKSKLNHFLKNKPDFNEFKSQLESNNIYCYKSFDSTTNSNYIIYGDKASGLYLTDKQLGKQYCLAEIDRAASLEKPVRLKEEQKSFLKVNVSRGLARSKTFEDFQLYLKSRNIEIIFAENSGGKYGISFKSLNVENPFTFKGSELDKSLSFNNIKANLIINLDAIKVTPNEVKGPTTTEITPSENSSKSSFKKLGKAFDDDEEEEKKKRNKNNDQSF